MKLAIMQPYFFPYIGYFQLMNAVDQFVVYDNIEFSKKGWVNRNRILVNGQDSMISLPLRKDSDYLDIVERYLADVWPVERKKMLNRIVESYRKAPMFKEVVPLIEKVMLHEENNLFRFILHSLETVKNYLEIPTPLTISSTIDVDHDLKAEMRVMATVKACHADTYINPIGGIELYNKDQFKNAGIELHFLRAKNIPYKQFDNQFVPFLSIVDVMMFNSKEQLQALLQEYSLE